MPESGQHQINRLDIGREISGEAVLEQRCPQPLYRAGVDLGQLVVCAGHHFVGGKEIEDSISLQVGGIRPQAVVDRANRHVSPCLCCISGDAVAQSVSAQGG